MRRFAYAFAAMAVMLVVVSVACGGNAANRAKIGAECATTGQCENDKLTCLTQFKAGYCGASGCTSDATCPEGSMCVKHTDGVNYCFLICTDKAECNVNRTAANEANCSSNITPVDGGTRKACVPPSGT